VRTFLTVFEIKRTTFVFSDVFSYFGLSTSTLSIYEEKTKNFPISSIFMTFGKIGSF
jgi:hypothetical protein